MTKRANRKQANAHAHFQQAEQQAALTQQSAGPNTVEIQPAEIQSAEPQPIVDTISSANAPMSRSRSPSPSRAPIQPAGEQPTVDTISSSNSPVLRSPSPSPASIQPAGQQPTVDTISSANMPMPRSPSPSPAPMKPVQPVQHQLAKHAVAKEASGKLNIGDQAVKVRVSKANTDHDTFLFVRSEYDRIASLIGLATMGVMPPGSKMTKLPHCLLPKSPEMEAGSWTPGMLADFIGRQKMSVTRKYNGDGRSDLGFLKHCILYVHHLFPNGKDDTMKALWKSVKKGIEALKAEYYSKTPALLEKEDADSWYIEGWTPDTTYDKMFNEWIQMVKSFYKTPAAPSDGLVADEGDYLPHEFAASLQEVLKRANEVPQDGSPAAKAASDMKKVVEGLIATGSVPRRLNPMSDKVVKIWTKETIDKRVKKINKIRALRELPKKSEELTKLIAKIETTANQYAEIVKQDVLEVMSL